VTGFSGVVCVLDRAEFEEVLSNYPDDKDLFNRALRNKKSIIGNKNNLMGFSGEGEQYSMMKLGGDGKMVSVTNMLKFNTHHNHNFDFAKWFSR
jgi:hypothetical protein